MTRPIGAALAALTLGALSSLSPVCAVLALAFLTANALMRTRRLTLSALAGPCFGALIVGAFAGAAAAVGALFVWRLLADARWSVGEASRLAANSGRPGEATQRALAHAWTTPGHGLALVAFTAPHMVAGLPLDLPHVPLWIPLATGALALAAVFDWVLRRAADWRLGELAPAPAAHLLAHHVMFVAAFGLALDVSAGLVAMIAWRLLLAARAQPSLTAVP